MGDRTDGHGRYGQTDERAVRHERVNGHGRTQRPDGCIRTDRRTRMVGHQQTDTDGRTDTDGHGLTVKYGLTRTFTTDGRTDKDVHNGRTRTFTTDMNVYNGWTRTDGRTLRYWRIWTKITDGQLETDGRTYPTDIIYFNTTFNILIINLKKHI